MAKTTIIASPYIVKGETSITQDVFEAHAGEALRRGELCYLDDGALRPASDSAGTIDSDTAPFDAPKRMFIAMQDAEEGSGKVKATEIKQDTVLEGFVVDQASDDISIDQDEIGNMFRGYVDADGKWAIDNNKADGLFQIVDVDSNYMPYRHPDEDGFDTDGDDRYGRVQFKVRKDRLL